MTRPLRALRPEEHRNGLIADMAIALIECGACLSDDQDAILRLVGQGFRCVDVDALLDDAIAVARDLQSHINPRGNGNG